MSHTDARGGEPSPIGDLLRRVAAQVPPHLRDLADDAVGLVNGESEQDKRERQAAQRAGRNAQWAKRLPAMYEGATLAGLHATQDPGGKVSGWLDHPDSLTLVLVGPADRGKTHAAYAVGAEALRRGHTVVAYTLADLNAAMRPEGDPLAYERATTYEYLLLDDLGREQVTPWSLEQIQRIIDHRMRERLHTIVTTNLSATEIEERYGSPVIGRLTYQATIVKIDGPSLRRPAAW